MTTLPLRPDGWTVDDLDDLPVDVPVPLRMRVADLLN